MIRKPVGGPSRSDASLASSTDTPQIDKHNGGRKPRPFNLLGRTKSIRDEQHSPNDTSTNNTLLEPPERGHAYKESLKTAPIRDGRDRSFRDMMTPSSNIRQRSEDRQPTGSRDMSTGREPKENSKTAPSFSSNSGSHNFLNSIKSSATKGAGAIHKGLFGKGGRSGSTSEVAPPIDDEHYTLKVINRPLVEQTRLTRISKKLEDSRDKTEFWMPAFPWRAIDYLNYKGSDVEGLYRVPGSGPQIKKWQRRFDEGGIVRDSHLCVPN